MDYRILGPLEVLHDGRPLPLGGNRQRALLALLLLHANEVVSTDRLLDELWGEQPPKSGAKAVQVLVSQLRKALQDGSGRNGVLATRAHGYVLHVGGGELDRERFEALVEQGSTKEDPEERAALLREALGLWRGEPLADLSYESFAQAPIARLTEARLAALEDRIDADLALGRHSAVTGELEELVARHPLRERPRGQLMLALYRSGRQADALAAYQDARQTLVDELGVEPSPELRGLHKQILEQDPALGAFRKERPPAAPPAAKRRRRRLLFLAGAATVAVAAVLGTLVLARGGDGEAVVVPPNSVAVIDPAENRVVDYVPVDDSPGPIDAGAGAVWVLNRNSRTLSQINPRTREVVHTIGLSGSPVNMSAGRTDVWVTQVCGKTLLRIDPRRPEKPQTVQLPATAETYYLACSVNANAESVWAALGGEPGSLARVDIDPISGSADVGAIAPPPGDRRQQWGATAIAVGGQAVWAVDYTDGLARRIDPATGRIVEEIPVGKGPIAVAASDAAVWVANQNDDSISRIDVRTNSVGNPIRVGDAPSAVALGEGAVWVANSGDGTVSRIDPVSQRVVATIPVGNRPQGILVANGVVWVTGRRP